MASKQKQDEHDIRIKVGFFKHHKTQKLRRSIGAEGVLALLELMCWTRVNRHRGSLDGMSDEDVEIAGNWTGTGGAFVAALIETGWLDGETFSRKVHDWKEHQAYSFYADKRVAIAKMGAKARHSRTYAVSNQHAGSKQGASRKRAGRQHTLPAPTAGSERARDPAPLGGAVAAREAEQTPPVDIPADVARLAYETGADPRAILQARAYQARQSELRAKRTGGIA